MQAKSNLQNTDLKSENGTNLWCLNHLVLSDSRRYCQEQSVFVHRERRTSFFGAAGKIKIQSRKWLSDLHRVVHCWTAQGNKLVVMFSCVANKYDALCSARRQSFKDFPANSRRVCPTSFPIGLLTVIRSLIGCLSTCSTGTFRNFCIQ